MCKYSGNMNILVNIIQASLKQIYIYFFALLSMSILNTGRKNIYVHMHMCTYMDRKSYIQKCKLYQNSGPMINLKVSQLAFEQL